jgi:hypothetical protein
MFDQDAMLGLPIFPHPCPSPTGEGYSYRLSQNEPRFALPLPVGEAAARERGG